MNFSRTKYSHDHRKPAGVSRICSCGLSFHLSKTKRVPFESSTQGLSDGTLKSDLGLNTASAEAKNRKKRTFIKLISSKGQLAFEGQMWSKGSLRLGLQFDVSITHQYSAVQFLCNLFCKIGTFYLISLSNLHKSLHSI